MPRADEFGVHGLHTESDGRRLAARALSSRIGARASREQHRNGTVAMCQ